MTRTPSPKFRLYALLVATGSLAGLALGRPELVALAAPFAVYLALGLTIADEPKVGVDAELGRRRVLEGEEVPATVRLKSRTSVPFLALELDPSPEVAVVDRRRDVLRLRAGERREVEFRLSAERWGGYPIGVLTGRAQDRFGLLDYELSPLRLGPLRVFPRAEELRALIDPRELQATTGSRVSRQRGEGIEFADLRPFSAGDRVRRINWRATARRGTPYVSDRHPERNTDVILFLDTFADVGDERESTLALAVRAAASLAAAYLARRDRVGVLGFGGVLRGLGARLGSAQLYRIIDALIGSEVVFSYADKNVRFVPPPLLPPKALVIAISPLIDQRSISALFDLRARGFDLVVLDVSPVPFAAPGRSHPDGLAHRLWVLQREAIKARFEQLGVAVTKWQPCEPLQLPMSTGARVRRASQERIAA